MTDSQSDGRIDGYRRIDGQTVGPVPHAACLNSLVANYPMFEVKQSFPPAPVPSDLLCVPGQMLSVALTGLGAAFVPQAILSEILQIYKKYACVYVFVYVFVCKPKSQFSLGQLGTCFRNTWP